MLNKTIQIFKQPISTTFISGYKGVISRQRYINQANQWHLSPAFPWQKTTKGYQIPIVLHFPTYYTITDFYMPWISLTHKKMLVKRSFSIIYARDHSAHLATLIYDSPCSLNVNINFTMHLKSPKSPESRYKKLSLSP